MQNGQKQSTEEGAHGRKAAGGTNKPITHMCVGKLTESVTGREGM